METDKTYFGDCVLEPMIAAFAKAFRLIADTDAPG